jgi:N-methylhydantoinase A
LVSHRSVLRQRRLARDASFVKHGTTLVINALLQRAGAKTALLTTKGFRDVLEVGRGNRTQPFNLRFHREPPLIPRELRFEVDERIDASGRVRVPLDTAALGALAEALKSNTIEALAISRPTSRPNMSRRRLGLRRLLPDLFITTGTELTREWHEFERTRPQPRMPMSGRKSANTSQNSTPNCEVAASRAPCC